MKLQRLCFYTCLSTGGGGVPGQVHPQGKYIPPEVHLPLGRYIPPSRYIPWAGTPPRQVHPPGRYTPLGRYTPWSGTPRAGTPPRQVHCPSRYTPLGRYPPQGNVQLIISSRVRSSGRIKICLTNKLALFQF